MVLPSRGLAMPSTLHVTGEGIIFMITILTTKSSQKRENRTNLKIVRARVSRLEARRDGLVVARCEECMLPYHA